MMKKIALVFAALGLFAFVAPVHAQEETGGKTEKTETGGKKVKKSHKKKGEEAGEAGTTEGAGTEKTGGEQKK